MHLQRLTDWSVYDMLQRWNKQSGMIYMKAGSTRLKHDMTKQSVSSRKRIQCGKTAGGETSDKRERLLTTALGLFIRDGFDRTPTARISREAGVATGTLFHYFPTKEDLVNGLYLRCKDRMVEAMGRGIPSGASLMEQLRIVHANLLRWGVASPAEYAFFQQYSHSALIRANTREEGLQRFASFRAMVGEGIREHRLKPLPEDYLFELVSVMFMQSLDYAIAHPACVGDAAFMDGAFHLVWDAIRA